MKFVLIVLINAGVINLNGQWSPSAALSMAQFETETACRDALSEVSRMVAAVQLGSVAWRAQCVAAGKQP